MEKLKLRTSYSPLNSDEEENLVKTYKGSLEFTVKIEKASMGVQKTVNSYKEEKLVETVSGRLRNQLLK